MQKFIIKKKVLIIKTTEVEAESWNAAKALVDGDFVKYDTFEEVKSNATIEYRGESDE